MLGFTTEANATAVSESETARLVLSARPRGDFTTLVSIGIERLSTLTPRQIEAGPDEDYSVMEIEVR